MTGEELGRIFEGKTLQGRYHLKKKLAAGNFGAVFHAEHHIFGEVVREVAVKITANTGLSRDNIRDVFGEAIVSARVYDRLEGSGVTKYLVPVYDMGILDDYEGRGFIVMGLVRGAGSKPGRCEPPKRLVETIQNWEETGTAAAMEYMQRICEAVGALHQQNVIHRDLKPDNILHSESGQIRLVDLGLAAELDANGYAEDNAGTMQYKAPETGLQSRSSRASDVYSLGIIAYELLTGQSPFGKLTPPPDLPEKEVDVWMQREKVKVWPTIMKPSATMKSSAYSHQVEDWQDRLVLRCLNPIASARPQSAAELGTVIKAAGRGEGPFISGCGWADWFGEEERGWAAEAVTLKVFLEQWRNKPRDEVWFEAATKLAVCNLSLAQTATPNVETLLRDAEKLVQSGAVLASYRQRAAWYGGLASVMERRARAGVLRSEYREKESEAHSHL